jgi:hypothetical protein
MANKLAGERLISTNRSPRWESVCAGHHRGLQRDGAWTQGHKYRSRLASFPTAGACCPISPTPLGTADNTAVGFDPPKTPASSAWQTPPRGVDSRGQSCVRNELPRSKLRGIKPPLAYNHGPASLAGWMLVYRVDVLYVLHANLRTTLTGRLGDAVAYNLLHCPAA